MDIKEKINLGEKVFKSQRNITYYFEEGKIIKDKLIIIFSAVNPPYEFSYNYLSTLERLPCNKLFILDNFGDQGAYYMGENKDFSIETSVISLISLFQTKYGLRNSDIITVGSSKGGYAALYFGIKYSYGNVISGGPQTKLGDFLYDQGKNFGIAKFIAGEMTVENKSYLNNLLFNLLSNDKLYIPKIYLHVGVGDHHYKNHVTPLINELDRRGNANYTLNIEEYYSHDGIRKYFPYFLSSTLSSILDLPIEGFNPIKTIDINMMGSFLKITCNIVKDLEKEFQYAFYIYKDGKILEKIFYNNENTINYPLKDQGVYKCKVFVKNRKNEKFIQMSEEVQF